jgi:hypothetical protein
MEFQSIFTGSLLTLVLLVTSHLLLWPYRKIVRRVHAYVIGTTCIGVGVTLAAFLMGEWIIAITFWAVTGPGGLAIASAWLIRWIIEERGKNDSMAARIIQVAGERLNRAVTSGESDDRRN